MRIDILTLFPEMFAGPFDHSIMKRARQKGLADIQLHDIRTFARNKHRKVDDYGFGGDAGMVMMIQPIADCIAYLKSEREYDEVIFLTPDGQLFDQPMANRLSLKNNLILLCGHYKGIDERIINISSGINEVVYPNDLVIRTETVESRHCIHIGKSCIQDGNRHALSAITHVVQILSPQHIDLICRSTIIIGAAW